MLSTLRTLAVAMLCIIAAAGARTTLDEDAFLAWMRSNGVESRVTISRGENGVRGLYTTEDVAYGEVLVEIPGHLVLNCGSYNDSDMVVVLSLLREMTSTCSRFAPYLKVLPKANEVLDWYSLPLEYAPMLQSRYLESQVKAAHRDISKLYNGSDFAGYTLKETIGNVDISFHNVQYAASLAFTRLFNHDERQRLLMIPLADMANHMPDCDNWYTYKDSKTIKLMAGHHYKAGDEVCYYYGALRPDIAMIKYGYLIETTPPTLYTIDHHKFGVVADYRDIELDDAFTANSVDEYEAEYQRLQRLLDRLEAGAETLRVEPIMDHDYEYKVLLKYQRLRLEAIRHEMQRIQAEVAALQGRSQQLQLEDAPPEAAPTVIDVKMEL